MRPPSRPQRIVRSGSVFLNADGYGYTTITCPAGVRWEIGHQATGTNISAALAQTTAAQPVATVYQDSAPNPTNRLEGTSSGDGDDSDSTIEMLGGESITCEWDTPDIGTARADHAGLLATYVIRGLQYQDAG